MIATCTECDAPVHSRGWCQKHYNRMWRTGQLELQPRIYLTPIKNPLSVCRKPECTDLVSSNKNKNCDKHIRRINPKHPDYPGYRREVSDQGYIKLVNKDGRILEHRMVMASVLGRPLRPEENVHHLNGDRSDNRPENLELWTKQQPVGSRVEDKVKWAVELLTIYRPEMLK